MHLAIVDDDEDVRTALARLLRCMGHEVRVFESAEAFEAGTVTADCLIVDAGLPGVSGPELCERLRRKEDPTPVVLVTGGTDTKARDTCRAMDIATVVKPFDDVTLLAAIAAAVDRARHAR